MTKARVMRAVGLSSLLLLLVIGAVPAVSGASERPVGAAATHPAPSHTVWLCQPDQANDPCASAISATAVAADGSTKRVAATPNPTSKFDCFFVYPTVSFQQADNANLQIQAPEVAAAIDEASRFSQVCQMWAPMYRQRTESSLSKGLGTDAAADQVAYRSLLSGWQDYLAHDNHGRPVIFIGHSQGAAMLIRLLHNVIDPSPRLRKLMVSAVLLGGNVQVPVGKVVGGSFRHIPICQKGRQTGCVIAYSSFASPPPPTSLFGRPGTGVSLQSGQIATLGQQVACVNPVTMRAGPAVLTPYFLSAASSVPGVRVTTPWVTYPDLYTATCKSAGGATWLQIDVTGPPGDPRPTVTASLGPDWGLHLDDVTLALGNLVFDVALQEGAYH